MRKIGYFFAAFFCFYLLLEVSLRLVLCVSAVAGFIHPSKLIYRYYPELIPIEQASILNTDSTYDVLILSCSVLHKDWVDIVKEMNACIQVPKGFNQVKIYNASGVGHGSRDNLVKYDLLRDKHFDAVIYYDAINDSRLNNCPANVFKDDYSHYEWYDEINTITRHKEMDITVLPFFYDWMKIKWKAAFDKDAYIPKHFALRPEWLQYGSDLKSVHCYERNLKQVMDEAKEQHARFLYFTFAYYLPVDYSLPKFKNKTLDYNFCDHSRETEIWGTGANVKRFIDTINVSSKAWVEPYPNARWIDLNAHYPKGGKYFADVCHFSPEGIREFAGMVCGEVK